METSWALPEMNLMQAKTVSKGVTLIVNQVCAHVLFQTGVVETGGEHP